MAKIKKHAEFMDTLHSMINKEAAPAKTTGAAPVTGKPGADTHYTSVSKETEKVDKNKQGHPEHNPQEFKQEKASDPSDPSKTHKAAEETPVEETETKVAEETPVEETETKVAEETPVEETETKEAAAAVAPPDTKPAAPAKEDSSPVVKQAPAKKAEANEKLAQLGQQLLDTINEMQKEAAPAKSTGAATVTGKPGADTHYTSVSKETEKVDKNKQGHPESNPQEFKQEKAKDPSDPSKTHKSAEELELDKEASFELGRQFARAFLANKTAAVDSNIYKEAGRRDFEALIAQASAELDQESKGKQVKQASVNEEELQIKQAEEAGAQAFYALLKQAQEEEQANQVKLAFEERVTALANEKTAAEKKAEELAAKLAVYEVEKQKRAEEAELEAKFATWGGRIVDEVINRLKNEPTK